MSFLNSLKSLMGGVNDQVAKIKNKDFLPAAVGSAIAVSAADGTIDSAEKAKLAKFVTMHPTLKLFDSSAVGAEVSKFIGLFEFDNSIGMMEEEKALVKLHGNQEQGKTAVLLPCAIGGEDGDFDETEKAVVRKLAGFAGLNASEFNL